MKKKNKKIIVIVSIIVILIVILVVLIINVNNIRNQNLINNKNKLEKIKNEISSHYNSIVITNKEATIYTLNDGKYVESGTIKSGELLKLNTTEINENTKYFEVLGLDEPYYISYKDVIPSSEEESNQRYKNYIPFNEEIITNKETIFYNDNNEEIYKINKSLTLTIIINEDDYYYVEYNNKLLKIKKDNVQSVNETNIAYNSKASKIRTVAYHSFYDPDNADEAWCRNSICHPVSQIESHAKYLSDNNYFTLTMQELEWFIDGKINLPEKSVMITIDDGCLAQRGIDVLYKYKLNATVFLITSSYAIDDFTNTEYIEFHSHSDNLHTQNICPGGQGGGIKCLDKNTLLNDLKLSREKLGGTTVFCYPFYEYNDYSISVLKEAGFKMAFAGLKGNGFVEVGTDKYQIPRYTITSDEDANEFAKIINNS